MSREYVVSRYQPEMHTGLSQINRVMATLDEISEKVTNLLAKQDGEGVVLKSRRRAA
jgi:hypothetical protein